MARENRFGSISSKGVNLSDITRDINNERGHSVTLPPKTKKHVEDIDIDLIDEFELNDKIFGYNSLDALKNSIEKTDDAVIITVYKRSNGRYLCWDGNSRLKVLKDMGIKKITCNISGDEPASDHEKLINAICANTQRTFDPYHIAHEIQEVENSFRKEKNLSGDLLVCAVADVTGYKETAQKYYKQILKLDPKLQLLFDSQTVPFKAMLRACKGLPGDKIDDFVNLYNELKETNDETSELIEHTFATTVNPGNEIKTPPVVQAIKFGREFKEIVNLKKDESGNYFVPDSKKKEYLERIKQMRDELDKIESACM